jgi:hypothetical protein
MDGQIWDAVLQPAPARASEATPVVVLSNDEVLLPADAEWGEFTIVEATDEERATLKEIGYSMADWNPLQGLGCGGCHVDGLDNEPLSDDTPLPGA